MILKAIAALFRRSSQLSDREPSPVIKVRDEAFEIIGKKGLMAACRFDEIERIEAYKRDEFTTDLICCDVFTGHGESARVWFIHEEMLGFEDLIQRLAALGGHENWYADIMLPAFAENRTVIFDGASVRK